jgi:large subunit ribosomal protein L31
MKKDIHPTYNQNVKVTCSCGNTFITSSTLSEDINIELCSKCHPFYTGEQKIVDSDNLVKKFKERAAKTSKMSYRSKKEKMASRKAKKSPVMSKGKPALTLKDMLDNISK